MEGNQGQDEAARCYRDADRLSVRAWRMWENWKEPASGEWLRTFAIITTNEPWRRN
jgi:hypothetical protein